MPTNNQEVSTDEEESDDLSTCCICFHPYDDSEREPKYLCLHHHNYCLKCIKDMARRSATATLVSCPKCKVDCVLPVQGPERLQSNNFVLKIIKQQQKIKNLVKNQHCWCLKCEAIPSATCEDQNHSVLDRKEDVDSIRMLKTQVASTLSQAVDKRQEIEKYLQNAIAANGKSLKKLQSLTENQLSAGKNGVGPIKEKLEEDLQQAKEELEEANKMWKDLNGSVIIELDRDGKERPQAKKRKIGATVDEGPMAAGTSQDVSNKFPSNAISAQLLSSSAPPLKSRDLVGQHGGQGVRAIEFSDDGTLFVSGGDDGRVLLWPTDKAIDPKWEPQPTAMNTQHRIASCLAVSPDNGLILSGGFDNNLNIHNVKTLKLLNSFKHLGTIEAIALQPGTNGNLFATGCEDGIVRLFDTRRNKTDSVIQSKKEQFRSLNSLMFSPSEPSVIAVGGLEIGAVFYDIRNLNSAIYSPSKANNDGRFIWSVQFNRLGTRLLCRESFNAVVYNIPMGQQKAKQVSAGKVELGEPDFRGGCNACCFAGIDDQLVISESNGNSLLIWSLPESSGEKSTVNSPLCVLTGHKETIRSVRSSPDKSTLISCDEDIIKLWTLNT